MWGNYLQEVAEEGELNEVNQKAWDDFQSENQVLQDLMFQNANPSMDIAQRDDVTTKLFQIKQTKK